MELLENRQIPTFNHVTSMKSFDCSTLYTTKRRHNQDAWVSSWQYSLLFAGKVVLQTVRIPMGTNCAPLLADIIQYSLSTGKKQLASRFNLTYRYNHKQPIFGNLSWPDVSCWTWDQGHHREYHFCFLHRFTSVDWEGWSTSHFYLRQTKWCHIPHNKLSVLEYM